MDNKNRKLCKTCIYRASKQFKAELQMGCDYIDITGHSRECPVELCDKYEAGNRKLIKSKLIL